MILLQVRVHDAGTTEEARSIRNLSILQRVNHTFKSSIDNSMRLQRAMLLASEDEDDPSREVLHGFEFLLDGQVSSEPLHPAFPCLGHCNPSRYRSGTGDVTLRLYIMQRTSSRGTRQAYFGCDCSDNTGITSFQEGISTLARAHLKAHFDRQASWRRMILSSKHRHIKISFCAFTKTYDNIKAAYSHWAAFDGAHTLGDLYEALAIVLQRTEAEHDLAHDDVKQTRETIKWGLGGWLVGARDNVTISQVKKLKRDHTALRECGQNRFSCPVCTVLCMLGEKYREIWDHL